MSRIGRTDVLRYLSSVFRLSGTRTSPESLDIERPITVVADVSRVAESLSQLVVSLSYTVTTGGAGAPAYSVVTREDVATTGGVESALRNLGLSQGNTDFWLIDFQAAVPVGISNFATSRASIEDPASTANRLLIGSAVNKQRFLGLGNVAAAPSFSGASQMQPIVYDDGTTGQDHPYRHLSSLKLPVRLSRLGTRTTDDGVGTTTVVYMPVFAFAPRGVVPSLG